MCIKIYVWFSCNIWWSTKVEAKSLFDFVIFFVFSSDIPLDFQELIKIVPLRNFMYFLAGIKTKYFWNIPEEESFALLGILNLFIKSFVNAFLDIALTFSDSSFNSISTTTCFAWFEVTFLFRFFGLLSKSVFYYEISNIFFVYWICLC